ncbi:hypothetical protein OICFNHDK_0207 [Methylobacterium bullatum]|uniref:Resolvase/invertase-type recombinase catalytic domain-containing protein n=1 Tax=Methylobacterium bullatum TaxID=570505 RepID=A0AAV4Z2H1_9HYPH|nr:hypothetical protein OICFNHDK_0207 [Methylobacterium bullatum]
MPPPNARTRERAKLTARHVEAARKLVASGRLEGRAHERADEQERGLVLRVGKQGGPGTSRRRPGRSASEGMDLPVAAAREAAQRSRIDLRQGRVPSKTNLRV